MSSKTIHIERYSCGVTMNGKPVNAEELSIRLRFARKPADLSQIDGSDSYRVFVTETRQMAAGEFDSFASELLLSRDWLAGKGGYFSDGRLCVEVVAPGRPILYVDPSGGDYARYVALLG